MDRDKSTKDRPDLSMLVIDKEHEEREEKRPPFAKWLWLLFVVIIVAASVAAWSLRDQFLPVPVETVTVRIPTAFEANSLLTASGYVVAQREADVSAKTVGTIDYLGVEEGSRVRKGQVVARLDVRDIEAQLQEAVANVNQGEKDLARLKALFEKGFTPFADVERAESKLEVNVARKHYVEAQIENAIIRAPFDGVVTQKNAEIGELITTLNPASPGIVKIVDMDSLEIEADVSESSLAMVREGQGARIAIDSFPGESFRGKLRQIVPTADRQKATVLVKVEFLTETEGEIQRFKRVLPDMSAQVTFMKSMPEKAENPEPEAIVLPSGSVASYEGQTAKIYLWTGEGIARERSIRIAGLINGRVEVLEGLGEGDRVIVSNVNRLADGRKVKESQ